MNEQLLIAALVTIAFFLGVFFGRENRSHALKLVAQRAVAHVEEHARWELKTNGHAQTADDKRKLAIQLALKDRRARRFSEKEIAQEVVVQLGLSRK